MLDPGLEDKEGLPLTCRAVFVIGPDKKLKLSLNYVRGVEAPAARAAHALQGRLLGVTWPLRLHAGSRDRPPTSEDPSINCSPLP